LNKTAQDSERFYYYQAETVRLAMSYEEKTTPKHIAVIMDGNGRWAQQKGWPRVLGHRAGVNALKKIVEACPDLGIKYLTVYAFSTENWKRPAKEIEALMKLLCEYIDKELNGLKENGVKVQVLGDIQILESNVRAQVEKAINETRENTGLHFSIALNYGGRQEILRAAQLLARKALEGQDPAVWTEEDFQACLYTKDIPDPDLLIRTGGELRVSNFLLWQIAYTELWITPVYWPDFTPEMLAQAIKDYQMRQRRFGGI